MRQVRSGFLLVAGALALAACASHPPARSTGTAAATGNAPVAGAAVSDPGKTIVPSGYKLVVKHGTQYFCRTQAVTGSHTLRNEVCLTQAEFDAQKTHSESIELNHAAASAR